MCNRNAFTLVELLIIMALLSILAAIVVPKMTSATDTSRIAAMASNVQLIRGQIAMHAARADVAMSEQGFPTQVHADWFPKNTLPEHAWTGDTLRIEVVNGDADDVFPASKTYNTADANAKDAWYNTANGAFCVRIPPQSNAAETLDVFNLANATSAAALNATSH